MALLADVPSWLSVSFARDAAVGLAVTATVLLVCSMFLMRSVVARVLSIVLLGCAVVGLLHYRAVLEHCDKNGCACRLFGQELEGGGCKQ